MATNGRDCSCKHEMRSDQDMLDKFVWFGPGTEPARETAQHYELVVRTSCGGTDIYPQVEDHHRIFHNELRNVLQKGEPTRRKRPNRACTVNHSRKKVVHDGSDGEWRKGCTLVEATTEFCC
jgi:hypothetical protein